MNMYFFFKKLKLDDFLFSFISSKNNSGLSPIMIIHISLFLFILAYVGNDEFIYDFPDDKKMYPMQTRVQATGLSVLL